MVRDRPTLFERTGRPLASAQSVAEREGHDSMAVHCGRCGKLLMIRLEDIKDKRTIDCEECVRRSDPLGTGYPSLARRALGARTRRRTPA